MNFGFHPINLVLRFLLEVIAFLAPGFYAFYYFDGLTAIIVGIGCPIVLMFIWGAFAVPGDKSRSGKTLIKTPGILRLVLELLVFGCGTFSLYLMQMEIKSITFLLLIVFHYALSADRIKWLINQK